MSLLHDPTLPRDRAAEVEADVAPYRGMTPEEHDEMLQRVVRAAFAILSTRDDWRALVAREPPAPGYEALLRRYRRG